MWSILRHEQATKDGLHRHMWEDYFQIHGTQGDIHSIRRFSGTLIECFYYQYMQGVQNFSGVCDPLFRDNLVQEELPTTLRKAPVTPWPGAICCYKDCTIRLRENE